MIVEDVKVLETGILDLVLLGGSVEVGDGVDDGLQTGLAIRVFDERLQHLRVRLRPRAERVNDFATGAFGARHLRSVNVKYGFKVKCGVNVVSEH